MKRLLELNKFTFFYLALSWTIVITLLSLFSLSRIPKIELGLELGFADKIIHFFFYLILTIIWHLYFYVKWRFTLKKYVLVSIALGAFIYGMLIEVLQDVLPYDRSAEWADILANTFGVITGTVIIVLLIRNHKSLKRKN